MGTRSLTLVKDELEKTIICLYRQYDGYPSCHGVELYNFLKDKQIVNGIPIVNPDDREIDVTKMANGFYCLAAQLVAYFKDSDAPGDFYLYPPDTRDVWEEYIYTIYPNTEKDGDRNVFYGKKIMLKIEYVCGESILFDDLIQKFNLDLIK